jgi:hypothetical protein
VSYESSVFENDAVCTKQDTASGKPLGKFFMKMVLNGTEISAIYLPNSFRVAGQWLRRKVEGPLAHGSLALLRTKGNEL